MPAEFDSGFFYNQPAWHGEGNVKTERPKDWPEAREWSGLIWEPVYAPNFGFNGLTADGTVTHDPELAVTGAYERDDDTNRIIRSDTGAKLSVRDESYEIITHEEMGAIVEALLDQPNIKYETAGSVMGGRRVWVLVYLDEPVTLPGDLSQSYPYMACLNRHDGTGACKGLATSVRVVCSNTFSAAEAEAEKTNAVFTFRHAKNWRDHMEEARQAVRGQRESFRKYVEIATDLAKTTISEAQTELFLTQFLPVPADAKVSDRVARNVEEARQAVRRILASPTVEGAGIGGTAFGLLQASGEYLDHVRKVRKEGGLVQRQLLSTNRGKVLATHLIREIVKTA